jgi:hypothetical protein
MTTFQFANRASAHLASPLALGATELTLAPGTGDRFPAARPDAPIQVTVVSATGSSEIVRCHDRSGDVLKDLWRGQENSSVNAFDTGSLVELRLTAEVLNSFLPLGGGTMQGDIELRPHTLYADNIQGSPYVDYVRTNAAFPPDGNVAGAIELLNGGVHPRINGSSVLTPALIWGAVFLWWGWLRDLPPWLKVCDGSLGTPDLRSRFPLGADSDDNMSQSGGQFQIQSYPAGAHSHDGATGQTQLGAFNLPALSAPTLQTTTFGLLREAFAAGTADTFKQMVATVKIAGGGTYSGSPAHAHGIGGVGDHVHLVDTVPPFVRLHYVMFRGMQIN